jgi:glycosyltransferase involved in cell wall biosynthesis
MKIAVLSSASAGGAGIAAYRIYQALQNSNHEADFIDLNVVAGAVCQEVSPSVSASNKKITNTHFTVDYANDTRGWLIDMLREYDVINIQWASYLVSLGEILELAKLNKKIVFTMHDFYYITGGCHYPAGCNGFQLDCAGCPQASEKIISQRGVINAHELKREIFSYPNVILAAPSNFIVTNAIKSGIVPPERARVIRNVYSPMTEFKPQLKSSEKSILLIADSFDEQRKGLSLAVDSLKLAADKLPSNQQGITLHLVGGLDAEVVKRLDGTKIRVVTHGHIAEHERLVDIFQECHFILSCSYEDNWPNILVEAGCYGCIPIVGRWHGCEEFVLQYNVGYISNDYTPKDFSIAINKAVFDNSYLIERQQFVTDLRSSTARARIAKDYIDVFLSENLNVEYSTHVSYSSKPQNLHAKVKVDSPFGPRRKLGVEVTKGELLSMAINEEHSYGIVDFRFL